MTIARIRDQARRFARVNSTWTSGDGTVDDEHVDDLIHDALRKFATDVRGLEREEYLAIEARFTTRTTMGMVISVKESDGTALVDGEEIVLSDRTAATGATIAADLQTAIRAMTGAAGTETVTWSAFKFTIDFKQGASIEFGAPDSVTVADATAMLGLTGDTITGTVFTGAFPRDCTVAATLPTDIVTMQQVEWGGARLTEQTIGVMQSPRHSGTPRGYTIRGRDILLIPAPTTQGMLHAWYKGHVTDPVFTGYQGCGLSGLSSRTATGLAATTQYYFEVAIDGGATTEYNITTEADLTFGAAVTLMNAQVTGAEFAIVGGDLRCSSEARSGVSSISLAAGTTGTDLFATLTGFTAFATAVAGDESLSTDIPEIYQPALQHLVAANLASEAMDRETMMIHASQYERVKNAFIVNRANMNTEIEGRRRVFRRNFRVS